MQPCPRARRRLAPPVPIVQEQASTANRDIIYKQMTSWDRWLRRPQSLWLRKAIFQIHLWTGIGLGIYVVLISVSGSVIVFRNELYGALSVGPKVVAVSGPRLSRDALKKAVHETWPGYDISYIFDSKRPNEATEVWLEHKGEKHPKTKGALFHPLPGGDHGP